MFRRFIAFALGAFLLLTTVAISGCDDSDSPGESKDDGEKIKLITTLGDSELGTGVYDEYLKTHPDVDLEVMPMSNGDTKLLAMIASGSGPDIIRINAFEELPSFVSRGILLPLDEYLQDSQVAQEDDWFPVTKLYRFDGTSRGQGSIYGFLKDWSCDNSVWINKRVFQAANEPLPSDTDPMTWEEFAQLAKRLTVKNGDNIQRFGLVTHLTVPTLLEIKLASEGKSTWANDYTSSTLKTESTISALQYWFDLQSSGSMASPLHPASDGIGNTMLAEGTTAMVMSGYWLSAYYRQSADNGTNNVLDDLMLIPGPTYTKGQPYNVCLAGTGAGVFSGTKYAQEAYELLEFMMFSDYAVSSRVSVGWGIPAIQSKMNLLPNSSEFDKQALGVVERTATNLSLAPRANIYITYGSMNTLFDKYYNQALYGKISLSEACEKINKDVQLLINEGMEIAGK